MTTLFQFAESGVSAGAASTSAMRNDGALEARQRRELLGGGTHARGHSSAPRRAIEGAMCANRRHTLTATSGAVCACGEQHAVFSMRFAG